MTGSMPRATSGEAWLELVTRTLREHDTRKTELLNLDVSTLTDNEKLRYAEIEERFATTRALLAEDVKNAAARIGLTVDENGYPTTEQMPLPGIVETAQDMPRNGFLSPEDAQRLAGLAFGHGGESSPDGVLSELVPMLVDAMTLMTEKMKRDAASARVYDADGRIRFKQIVVLQSSIGSTEFTPDARMVGLDAEGHVWHGELNAGALRCQWRRIASYATVMATS